MRNYAKIDVLKTNQLKFKGNHFNCQQEHQSNFEKITQALVTDHILSIVNPTKPFVVEMNASDKAINAVLLPKGRPIAFESKKLDKA